MTTLLDEQVTQAHELQEVQLSDAEIVAAMIAKRTEHLTFMQRLYAQAIDRKIKTRDHMCWSGFNDWLEKCNLPRWNGEDKESGIVTPPDDRAIFGEIWKFSGAALLQLMERQTVAYAAHRARCREQIISAMKRSYIDADLCNVVLRTCDLPTLETANTVSVTVSVVVPTGKRKQPKTLTKELNAALNAALAPFTSDPDVTREQITNGVTVSYNSVITEAL